MTLPIVLVLGHRFSALTVEEETLAGVANVVDGNALTPTELAKARAEAEAILLGTRTRLDAADIAGMLRCRAIVRYGVGADNIDVDEATRRGIPVANVPDYCVDEVSDHAVTLLLAVSRHLVAARDAARQGTWGTSIMQGVARLSTQTVGVVGFGRIGRAVAHKVRPFVARVLAFDPVIPAQQITEQGAEPVGLTELLETSDYVSLHCPLMSETRHLLNAQTLARMKPNAWLINTSRGELIDEAALVEALVAHRVGGAALDVLSKEPPPESSLLLRLDNVLVTPHVAYYSESAVVDLRRTAAEQTRTLLLGGRARWLVNPTVIQPPSEQEDSAK